MAGAAMNDRHFTRGRFPIRLLAALLPLALPAACAKSPAAEAPLAGAALGGAFSLTDQDGKPVRDTDFTGRYRLFYFGYTYCPDVCPVDLQKLAAGLKLFEAKDPTRAAKLQPIFVTVDPARDTPSVLKSYVAAFHPRLIGLTGTPAQTAEIVKRYGATYQVQDNTGASGYLVNHTTTAILYGPDGAPITIVPHDQGPEAVAAELDRWVR